MDGPGWPLQGLPDLRTNLSTEPLASSEYRKKNDLGSNLGKGYQEAERAEDSKDPIARCRGAEEPVNGHRPSRGTSSR